MKKWRLLDTGKLSAAENMALDDAILRYRSGNLIPNTMRFLQFDPPAVLVGYHQDVEHEVRLDYVKKNRIDVNRRLTGGGAIYFDKSSLGWEIIASKDSILQCQNSQELFRSMCEGPVHALNMLGIPAAFRPRNDIEVNGRKISGTGGVERDDTLLFQGTLLVDFDIETMIQALRIPIVKLKDKELKSARERVTCIKWELGYQPHYQTIKEALKRGFERSFNIKLVRTPLAAEEKKALRENLPAFQSDQWVFLDRRPPSETAMLEAIDKLPGGLVHVSLAVDRRANCIKSIVITGDFFTFPSRAILDLEAALKLAPSNEDSIRKIVDHFFATNVIRMPGICAADLANLIIEAVDKASYEGFGITLTEVNDLYPITKQAKRVLADGCDYVLLPYCAKSTSCKYRRTEGCSKCGGCSFGEAYELSESVGLKPVTIQNFEHLIETLNTMKNANSKGYIGCCCSAFYSKHRHELEEAGVPGILVDLDDQTCYDLGKAQDAYDGNFEAQTQLKTELLSKLLNRLGTKRIVHEVVERCGTSMS